MKLQHITWEDHCSYTERWREPSEVTNEPVIVDTVGWVLQENEKYVTITACTSDEIIKHVQTIIKSCITKRRTIK